MFQITLKEFAFILGKACKFEYCKFSNTFESQVEYSQPNSSVPKYCSVSDWISGSKNPEETWNEEINR